MPAEASRTAGIVVQRVGVDRVRPLRLQVLRPGRPAESVVSAQDDLRDTVHFAALRDGEVIGVMTVFSDPAPNGGRSALRIRWMAVRPEVQRGGVGRLLLDQAIGTARRHSVPVIWAFARDTALGFYRRNGFTVIGDSFIDAETGIAHTPVLLELQAA